MITIHNFITLLKEETKIPVQYRYGELYLGYTSWSEWRIDYIEHIEGASSIQDGFNIVGMQGHQWSYEGRQLAVEEYCQEVGFVFGRYEGAGNEHCIQIRFI